MPRGRRWGERDPRPGGRCRGPGAFGGGDADPLLLPWPRHDCCLGAACRPHPRAGRRGGVGVRVPPSSSLCTPFAVLPFGTPFAVYPPPSSYHPLCAPTALLPLAPKLQPPSPLALLQPHPEPVAISALSPSSTLHSWFPVPCSCFPLSPCIPHTASMMVSRESTGCPTFCHSRCPLGSDSPLSEQHPSGETSFTSVPGIGRPG